MKKVYTVIMAGGSGTRFWPLSRKLHPKQFLPLAGDGSTALITATARRVATLSPIENVFVVTRADLADAAKEALPELPVENLMLEPAGRNTGPCVAWATAMIQRILRHTTMRTQWHYRHADEANLRDVADRIHFGPGPDRTAEGQSEGDRGGA